jgi:hypothetical protein
MTELSTEFFKLFGGCLGRDLLHAASSELESPEFEFAVRSARIGGT